MTQSTNGETNTFVFEWSGQLSGDEIRWLIDQFGGEETVTNFRIEIESDRLDEMPTLLQPSRESEHLEDAAHTDSQPSEADDTENIPRLQPGATPFQVMRVLDAHDTWLRTDQIHEASPDDWDLDEDNARASLWKLVERGLIEKRPYEEDKRHTEYRITSRGKQAIDEALDRAENQPQADEFELLSDA